MKVSIWTRSAAAALILLLAAGAVAQETTETETEPAVEEAEAGPQVVPCPEFPAPPVDDARLKELVPDSSPGRVFIRWKTESQEDNYGFNIYRATKKGGPYEKITPAIIPGEGTTNIPKEYCYVDMGLPRGSVFFYYIESVSNKGVAEVVEGTMDTEVTVKTVEAERIWLRKKIMGETAAPAPADAASTGTP